ncbi:GPW/gp25 family protein [Pantoea sp. A4]|uniref:GPW/gp25 family protein n=1 Tax=Pantoea sp. A4 TaxID=1225184 RepID=UPI000378238A|nr:GPW/gp25 family protein [Pantoea sp. A4]
MPTLDEIHGRGWAFPPRFSLNSGAALAANYVEDIQQSLRILFNTLPLERVMHAGYGCDLHEVVFANVNADLLQRITTLVRESITRYEPRVALLNVEALFEDVSVLRTGQSGFNVLRLQVSYKIQGSDIVLTEEGFMDVADGRSGVFA